MNKLSAPETERGRLQQACLGVLCEHQRDDASVSTYVSAKVSKQMNQENPLMSDEAKKPRLPVETPSDASDLDSLWLDSSLGDGITDVHYHEIPVGKPKDFFRTHPDKRFRR